MICPFVSVAKPNTPRRRFGPSPTESGPFARYSTPLFCVPSAFELGLHKTPVFAGPGAPGTAKSCRANVNVATGAGKRMRSGAWFGASDIDPYHAPLAAAATATGDGGLFTVSNETMWPIIQPNRIRSFNLIEDDTVGTNGLHNPALLAAPQLFVNGAPVSIAGKPAAVLTAAFPESPVDTADSDGGRSLVPASPTTQPNVYMAHEVPEVHIDQTWNVTYEGILPGFDGVVANITSTDFTSLTFSNANAFFCGHGVEDQRLGLQRFAAMQVDDAVLAPANGAPTLIPTKFDQRVGDYVQLTDDIVGAAELIDAGTDFTQIPQMDDPAWHENFSCWAGLTDKQGHPLDAVTDANTPYANNTPFFRQQVCIDKFGAYGQDQNTQRDFPILQAFEDHLVVGRYLYLDATNRPSNGRIVAPPDTQAQIDFKMAQCCFHNQAHFHVRTGGEWVALGSLTPYLHHVVADPTTKACVQSCDPTQVLLSSRVAETTFPATADLGKIAAPPNRNSPFSMRNAALSYFLPTPAVSGTDANSFFTVSLRDFAWQFQTRGQYQPAAISLTGTTTAVVPQSSMFLAPLGAIAVVDGSAEGLFIIDLNTLLIADGSPFF